MTWYRHLPYAFPCTKATWAFRWESPLRLEAARALVEHFEDERVAHWSVVEDMWLDAMASKERVRAAAKEQGLLF